MNTLAKINRAKEQTASEILEGIGNIHTEYKFSEDFYNKIRDFINEEYLYKSDYTD